MQVAPRAPLVLQGERVLFISVIGFHISLASHLVQQCIQFREQFGDFAVGLTGGVFQNKLLSEHTIDMLSHEGFRFYLAERIPCNDGGLCYGQVIEVACKSANY